MPPLALVRTSARLTVVPAYQVAVPSPKSYAHTVLSMSLKFSVPAAVVILFHSTNIYTGSLSDDGIIVPTGNSYVQLAFLSSQGDHVLSTMSACSSGRHLSAHSYSSPWGGTRGRDGVVVGIRPSYQLRIAGPLFVPTHYGHCRATL
jgi:hypothetical protein